VNPLDRKLRMAARGSNAPIAADLERLAVAL